MSSSMSAGHSRSQDPNWNASIELRVTVNQIGSALIEIDGFFGGATLYACDSGRTVDDIAQTHVLQRLDDQAAKLAKAIAAYRSAAERHLRETVAATTPAAEAVAS